MLVALDREAHLHFAVRNYDGDLVTSSPTVNIVVRDVDGDTVASGSATASVHGNHATGWYDYVLPTTVTGTLGVYEATAVWTISGVTSSVTYPLETVSAFLFDIADLRAFDAAITANAYSADTIRSARDWATERIERAAQCSFSTRRKVITVSGDGTNRLLLPDVRVTKVHSVTLYGEDTGVDLIDDALDATEIADVEIEDFAGVLVRTSGNFPVGQNNIVVDYEYGYTAVPDAVRRAAMLLAIEYLVPSALPARATAQATDLGDFRISLANVDAGRDTGIPEVDAVIATYGAKRPRIG